MGICTCSSKLYISILSVILWAFAGGLIWVSVWSLTGYTEHLEGSVIATPAYIMLGIGVFLFFLGICGCIGAIKESKVLLSLFCFVLLLVLLGYLTVIVLGFVYSGKVANFVDQTLKDDIHNYGNDSNVREWFDNMQEGLKCCGSENYTDWLNSPYFKANGLFPKSCCKNESMDCSPFIAQKDLSDYIYTEGCYKKLKDQFMHYLGVIIAVAISFAVILIVALVATCAIMCKTRNEAGYVNLSPPEAGSYRV